MSSSSDLHDIDPAVVPIIEQFDLSMDDWLAGLRTKEPLVLDVSTADLLADARRESE